MKRSSTLASTRPVYVPNDATVEPSSEQASRKPLARWVWPLLLLTLIFSVHCSGEEICPVGTSGEPCKPNVDLGPQPEVPATHDTHIAETVMGESDGAVDAQPKDTEQNDLNVREGNDTHPARAADAADEEDGLPMPTDDTEQADATRESARPRSTTQTTAKLSSEEHPATTRRS